MRPESFLLPECYKHCCATRYAVMHESRVIMERLWEGTWKERRVGERKVIKLVVDEDWRERKLERRLGCWSM